MVEQVAKSILHGVNAWHEQNFTYPDTSHHCICKNIYLGPKNDTNVTCK